MSSSPNKAQPNNDFGYDLTHDEVVSLIDVLRSIGNQYEDANPIEDCLDYLTSGRNKEQKRDLKVTIVAMGECDFLIPHLITICAKQVDLVKINSIDKRFTISYQQITAGTKTATEEIKHEVFDLSLIAYSIKNVTNKSQIIPDLENIIIYLRPEINSELAETILGTFNDPYFLFFESAVFSESILRLENGSNGCFVPDKNVLELWKQKHVVEAQVAKLPNLNLLFGEIEKIRETWPPSKTNIYETNESSHRVLLVSYFALPTHLVSTQRISYWHETLESLGKEKGINLEVVWLSATKKAETLERNRVISDRGDRLVSSKLRSTLYQSSKVKAPNLGMSWSDHVQTQVKEWDDRFDTVVISVGPFGYMDLASFFKRIWGSKVIIDFRDPYAGNPRMIYTPEQKSWLAMHESECVDMADIILAVNQQCLDAIAPNIHVPKIVLKNGYDDRKFDHERNRLKEAGARSYKKNDVIEFGYCGTIYRTAPLEKFFEALSPDKHRFRHFGRDQTNSPAFEMSEAVIRRGYLDKQEELARELLSCHAGIIRLGAGDRMADTTKIFDYIGCDLDIIVITDGKVEDGAIHELTQCLDGVFWVKNELKEIQQFLTSYEPSQKIRSERQTYSRKSQTQKLLELIVNKNLFEVDDE